MIIYNNATFCILLSLVLYALIVVHFSFLITLTRLLFSKSGISNKNEYTLIYPANDAHLSRDCSQDQSIDIAK